MSHDESIRFLLQLAVLLSVALILGQSLQRYGFPAVFGEIAGGILLGPTVLGTWAPQLQSWLFPTSGSIAIGREAVVKLGLLSFLFAAGLEMNLTQIRTQRWCVLSTSLMGMLLPFAMGYGMVIWHPSLWAPTGTYQPMLPTFMGTALAISALPVIARILMDLRLQPSDLGTTILAAASLDDLVGWLLFAMIVSRVSPTAGTPNNPWVLAVLVIGVWFMILTFGRWATQHMKPWFRGHVTGLGSLICVAMVLTFVAGAAFESLGVHSVFGAFLAGMMLAQGRKEREPVHEMVHQYAIGVFAPLYFVSIGLKINFAIHFDSLLVALVLLIACVGKIVGAGLGARIGGLSLRQALAVGFGMNARGAMEIVLASLALDYGMIDQRIFVGLVVMALATSLLSGPAMKWVSRPILREVRLA